MSKLETLRVWLADLPARFRDLARSPTGLNSLADFDARAWNGAVAKQPEPTIDDVVRENAELRRRLAEARQSDQDVWCEHYFGATGTPPR